MVWGGISHGLKSPLGSDVAILQVGKMNSPVLTGRRYALTVGNPSTISRTTDKTLYGGNIHTKLQSCALKSVSKVTQP
jgi:hypothetical protein